MKKIIPLFIAFLLVCPHVNAFETVVFGNLTWATDNGFTIYADGGTGQPVEFGFVIEYSGNHLYLRQYRSSFNQPYSVTVRGLPTGNYLLYPYAINNGVYEYGQTLSIDISDVTTIKNLFEAKASALAEIADATKNLSYYSDTDKQTINEIVSISTETINNAKSVDVINLAVSDVKSLIKSINIAGNTEPVQYFTAAYADLTSQRYTGKARSIMNIVLPIAGEVITNGTSGSILITNNFVRDYYATQIAAAKKIYREDMTDYERSLFNEQMLVLDADTQEFLTNFFL